MNRVLLVAWVGLVGSLGLAETDQWVTIFNGQDLTGWKVNEENPESVFVKDGAIVVHGPRTHVFYHGPAGDHDFSDFELRCKVKTTPGSNSGIYFHTEYQDRGWPSKGFEAQVNNSGKDRRKTGSLYAVKDVHEAPAEDNTWFDYYIKVEGDTVVIKVNGETTVQWTQPDGWEGPKNMPGRKLSSGTIAFQAHDPDSKAMYKDIRLKVLD